MPRKLLLALCLLSCPAFIIQAIAQGIPHFIEKLTTEVPKPVLSVMEEA
jgi:hypothetical protein